MPIKRSIRSRLYIFKRYLKYTLSFSLLYCIIASYYVSNIRLLYPNSILVSYRDASFGGTKKDDIILNFNKKLASIEFLEKIREESDYMVEMTALDSYLNHAKLAAANFLPKNLNPNSWNFGLEFLEKSKTWASLRKNIKIISHSDSNTFEIYCLSETPIMAQAVCEKLSYNLTLEVLEKKKNKYL